MATIPLDVRFREARKDALAVASSLQSIEAGPEPSVDFQGELSAKLNKLARDVEEMESLVAREPSSKRQLWRKRISHLREDTRLHRKALEIFLHRTHEKVSFERDRDELFERRRKAGEEVDVESGNGLTRGERKRLGTASSALDDVIASGVDVLENLRAQGQRLQGARRKLADIAGSLGLSRHVIQLIERRQSGDAIIVAIGIILCTVFAVALMWLLGKL